MSKVADYQQDVLDAIEHIKPGRISWISTKLDGEQYIVMELPVRLRDTVLAALRAQLAPVSEDVQRAIEYAQDWKKESMQYDESVGIFPASSDEAKAYDTIIRALQQYKPVEPCVVCIKQGDFIYKMTPNGKLRLRAPFCPECGRRLRGDAK